MDKIINLEEQKKRLQTVLDTTGGKVAAFYVLKHILPSFQGISWEEVESYKNTLGLDQEPVDTSFPKQKILKPKNDHH